MTIDKEGKYEDAAGRSTSEGYKLSTTADGVTIAGASPLGAWWGTRSLLQQAVLDDDHHIPAGSGSDAPGWSTRGMMLDCGRHFYPKEFLIDLCSYMSFFKQNVFHVHLSDNTIVASYTPDNFKDTYARFRLWSESSSVQGLNKHHNESYTRDDFEQIQQRCARRGVTILPEIEAPGHALPFVQWKPQIGYDGDLSLLNITHPDTIPTLKTVWKEFLPWFHSKSVSIGADEYKGPEEDYKKFVNEMAGFIGQEADKNIRIWGTFYPKKHTGSNMEISSNVTIQHWAYLFGDPLKDDIKNEYSIINSDEMFYIVMKDGPYGRTINLTTVFTGNPEDKGAWSPNIFNLTKPDENPSRNNPLLQGAISPIWNDHGANTSVYSEAYYAWRDGLPALADKHWGGKLTEEQFHDSFAKIHPHVPDQDLERSIPSKGKSIFQFKLDGAKAGTVKDSSSNKYDAETTCKSGDKALAITPDCELTTPWASKGRNYTLSLTLKVDKLDDKTNTTIVSGKDSALMLTPNLTLFASGIYYRLNVSLPLQQWVQLEISSRGPQTFATAKSDNGDEIFPEQEFKTHMSYYGAPLRWRPMAIEAPINKVSGWTGQLREFSLEGTNLDDSESVASSLPSANLWLTLAAVIALIV